MGWFVRLRGWAVVLLAVGFAVGAGAQGVAGVSARAAGAMDIGKTDHARRMEGMSLRFAMTAEQQSELEKLLVEQQRTGSAEYHRWLTPETFAARFGLPAGQQAQVVAWLQGQGLSVTGVGRGGLFVQFAGTVGQVNQAFGVEMHDVMSEGERHVANLTAPVLPKAIAGMTAGLTGLDDFGVSAKGSAAMQIAASARASGVQPQYTAGAQHFLAPGDIYTIYDENALFSGGVKGTGVTIAVVGQADIALSDIAAFRAAAGLPASVPTVALYGTDPGAGGNGDVTIAEAELEWAGATAPGAALLYVNSSNVINGSLTSVVDNNLAPIVVDGYGQCEASVGAAGIVFYEELLKQAAAQGMTILAAAGDSGATACDVAVGSATHGLAVGFPASSPYVTAVGGTEFNEAGGTYFGTTNGANGGSALSYIPEKAWDDYPASFGAGGGGASLYFSKPSWQTGTGVPADFSRDVPDVALSASVIHDMYLICLSGSCASGFSNGANGYATTGGTMLSTALFGGMLALVEQKTGGRIGVANPTLYALAGSSYAGSVFHDVTTGSNAVPCAAGSTGCVGTAIGYAAGAGYDQATGWGSVDAFGLVNDWSLVTALPTTGGLASTYTNVAASASPVKAGSTVTLTATVAQAVVAGVTPLTAVPTGGVQFTVDSVASGAAVALSGTGSATYSLNTTGLSLGTHTVQATYLGDANYAGSKGAFVLTVTSNTPADFTLTPSTTTLTVASGGVSPGVVFSVAAVNGFQGSVQFTASSTPVLAAQTSFSVNPVVLSSTATSGQTTFLVLAYTPIVKASVGERRPWLGGGVVLAGLLLAVWPRRRRPGLVLMVAMGVGLMGVTGCTAKAPTPPAATTTPTPAGTYAVTITAVGSVNGVTTSHTAAVSFVVQ